MKYYVHVKGRGNGCDYTIGCNHSFFKLDAETLEKAKEEMKINFMREGGGYGEETVESAKLYECTQEIDLPFKDWWAEKEEAEDEAERIKIEKEERESYEKLKKKFEG